MRLVDADAFIAKLNHVPMVQEAIRKAMDTMPTIEERKTGKWIPEFNGAFTGGAYWFRCSECGRIVPEVRNGGWDYCPKCGTSNV